MNANCTTEKKKARKVKARDVERMGSEVILRSQSAPTGLQTGFVPSSSMNSIPVNELVRENPGPSLDNIDLEALLAIRGGDSCNSSNSFLQQSDKPTEDDLLLEDPDFNLDLGRDYLGLAEEDLREMELKIEDANYYFNYGDNPDDVVNIAGEYKNKDGSVKEPFIITVLKRQENAKFRGVIRTKTVRDLSLYLSLKITNTIAGRP